MQILDHLPGVLEDSVWRLMYGQQYHQAYEPYAVQVDPAVRNGGPCLSCTFSRLSPPAGTPMFGTTD